MRRSLSFPLTALLCLTPAVAGANPPDLCADPLRDPTGAPLLDSTGMHLSKWCEWTHELDVVAWEDAVCCVFSTGSPISASCTATDSVGRCVTGFQFWCDFATVSSTGAVRCQQPWPDACAAGFCSSLPIGATPLEDTEPLCCTDVDVCTVVDLANPVPCGGSYLGCESPFSNLDGSVGCADDE